MFYSERLPKASSSVAQARHLLDQFDGDLSAPVLNNARLLVSELVTNAVEHVAEDGEIELRVGLQDGVLRVEVTDPGPGFTPRPRDATSRKHSGWGLHFVSRLADRWAADIDGRARVWFELARA